ncbi:MAG: transporter [Gemmatimonadota bacterium]|nr:MAG: transporter [Gemmatimonadota bacterium]
MCRFYANVLSCLLILSPLFCLDMSCSAEDDPVVADRPGFSSSTSIVGPGQVQIEMGYDRTRAASGDETVAQTFPLVNVRKGVAPAVEFNLFWRGWSRFSVNDQSSTAENDVAVGVKYAMHAATAHHVSFLGAVNLPTGDASVTSDHVDPTVGVIWDYAMTPSLGAFGTILGTTTQPESSRIYTVQPAVGASVSLSSGLSAFVEYFSMLPSEKAASQHSLDAGFTYLMTDDIQLDGSAGIGLDRDAPDFVGLGLVYRLNF